MLSTSNAEKENGRCSCVKYSGEDIALIGVMEETTNEAEDVTFRLTKESAQERLIWLANWFLSGVVDVRTPRQWITCSLDIVKDIVSSHYHRKSL